ncbi:acyl-CoA dehydrogenase [Corynebacterium sp. 3HC-13]|uniref:acyl-CoA dehydrogenase family protein n=1 Tax=Corynebacterium poyangense TaxID=2684405 RepID=UPI001CC9F4D7|nr:acyl-CoA dehydrogenase family protein [Corynebacterium poyangense]MBZ8177321.1 acyl-CoA dehydrogenase [Corynebacterium poyangense]
MNIQRHFTEQEKALQSQVSEFVDREVRPHIAQWYETATLPVELLPKMADLGLFGMHLKGYGCPGRSAVEYGIAMQELEAGDSGLRTVISVQGSLAMTAIHRHGSEEQKNYWLPRMARGEAIGCFGLTEPNAGSDPTNMKTAATQESDGWHLTGAKRWIGLASIADVAIIWAKVDGTVRGFVVPTDTPGFKATPIEQKLSMRASLQCDIELDVHLPDSAILPDNPGLKGPFTCLNEARYGIAWGALGAARDSIEVALDYAANREVFDRPLSSFQLTQKKLVDMVVELNKAQLLALELGRAKDAGQLELHQISVAKLANCRTAIDICREARTILGGNGITGDYSPLRHANNLESVRTYEGTDEVHTLIVGNKLTGHAAFR